MAVGEMRSINNKAFRTKKALMEPISVHQRVSAFSIHHCCLQAAHKCHDVRLLLLVQFYPRRQDEELNRVFNM